jgi:hypothetical protein
MNEITPETASQGATGILTKILAIIGFCVTLALIVWVVAGGITHAPQGFSSLASLASRLQSYGTVKELTIATENTVVNSKDQFQISWTDVKAEGEYHFSYECVDGIKLNVLDGEGADKPINCGDTLSLPASVHGLFLSIVTDKMRFNDVPLKLSFSDVTGTVIFTSELKMTVVNASVPVVASDEPVKTKETAPDTGTKKNTVTPRPVSPPTTTLRLPTVKIVYPQSQVNGYTDLQVSTLGIGMISGTEFVPTAMYDERVKNAVKVDVKNIGTKTSDTWTVQVVLPTGYVYESTPQVGLKPNEHVTFTIGFGLGNTTKDTVKITSTVDTARDTNRDNDESVWSVSVVN